MDIRSIFRNRSEGAMGGRNEVGQPYPLDIGRVHKRQALRSVGKSAGRAEVWAKPQGVSG